VSEVPLAELAGSDHSELPKVPGLRQAQSPALINLFGPLQNGNT